MNLIEEMETARASHLVWAKHQEYRYRQGKKPIAHVGGASHHRRWIRIYEAVIKELSNGNHSRR